ncbi:hypothetical protein THRCLA_01003 [Thraustotheca clavata]|uniref:Cyclin-like domain-containing protein n=1 Tax=Thraustotheca clavata TaxID=74557 RepID=A0A1W0A9L5_9STRA|nr:hypothetical protein THRCLA_01003 [Thraustotheca clavata]
MDLICHEEHGVMERTSMSMEAIEESLEFLRLKELNSCPNAQYMTQIQKDGMTSEWRINVCNWITSLAGTLNFEVTTTSLAMNYFDRYLSVKSIEKSQVELVAMACVLTASKFNEQEALTINEAASIATDHTSADIIATEKELLKVLEWKLHAVLPHHFMECWLEQLEADSTVLDLCLDFLSRTATDLSMLAFTPSTTALACITLAYDMLHMPFPTERFTDDMKDSYRQCKSSVRAIVHPTVEEPKTPLAPKKLKRAASPSGVEDVYSYDSPVVIKRQRLYSA